jgi:hypothetical protein
MYPIFSFRASMALLSASNGRITLAPAAIKCRPTSLEPVRF